MTASQPPASDITPQVLRSLVERHGGNLLRWHPDSEAAGSAEPLLLTDALWAELPALEAGLQHAASQRGADAQRLPLEYWSRRQQVSHRDEHRRLLAELPTFWRVVLDLPSQSVEALAVELGRSMLAAVMQGQAATSSAAGEQPWLAALEAQEIAQLRRRAATIADEGCPQSLRHRWSALISQRSTRATGTRLLRTLGMGLLASLLQEVSGPLRAMAASHARSEVFDALRAASANWLEPGDVPWAQSLAMTCLAAVRRV